MFGYTAEGAQQEADKFVGEAGNLEEDISKAASSLVPFYDSGVNIVNVAQEYMKPEEERDYDYIKSQFTEAGQSAAIEGGLLLMGGVAGKYGAKGIKALADKVKQYEIDPTAMSAFGAGAIKKKAVEPLEIGINEALQDGKFLKRYDASIAADMTEKVKNATAGNTRANALINTTVPEGTKVGIRLNLNSKIPDMPKGLDKLQTLHKGSFSGKALSYLPFATVKNVVFSVNQTGRTGIASKIKGIDTPEAKSKFNAMSVDGEYVPNKNLLDSNKDLVEIGFNPGVHHLFIDLKTGQAVRGAKEATVIGDRVFAKGVEYWKKTEAPKPVPTQTGVNIPSDVRYKFKRGGAVMDDQMKMAFMDEGGIIDDDLDVDPVSGNEVPPGSLAEEVRDDIPAQLSEGEYVVPADVVRYYGVKFFEDLRDQAKMGLAEMEANGRIGGEPVPAGGPINDEELSEQEMSAIRQMMTGMAEGGEVQNPYLQQQQLYSQPRPAPIDEKRNTTITGINPVENQMPMQSMASGGQVQGYQDSGDVMKDAPSFVQNQFEPAQYGLGYSFMGQPQQTATTNQAPQGQTLVTLYHPEYATNGRSKTFYLPKNNEIYQQYLGMGYTKQMPMTGSAEAPTSTDTPVTTDLKGSTVTTGSGPEGSNTGTSSINESIEDKDLDKTTKGLGLLADLSTALAGQLGVPIAALINTQAVAKYNDALKDQSKRKGSIFGGEGSLYDELTDVNKDEKKNFGDTWLGDLLGFDKKAGVQGPNLKDSFMGARRGFDTAQLESNAPIGSTANNLVEPENRLKNQRGFTPKSTAPKTEAQKDAEAKSAVNDWVAATQATKGKKGIARHKAIKAQSEASKKATKAIREKTGRGFFKEGGLMNKKGKK